MQVASYAGYCVTIIFLSTLQPQTSFTQPLKTGCKHQGICGPGIVWCPTYTRQHCCQQQYCLVYVVGRRKLVPRYRSIRLEADSPEQQGSKNSKLSFISPSGLLCKTFGISRERKILRRAYASFASCTPLRA